MLPTYEIEKPVLWEDFCQREINRWKDQRDEWQTDHYLKKCQSFLYVLMILYVLTINVRKSSIFCNKIAHLLQNVIYVGVCIYYAKWVLRNQPRNWRKMKKKVWFVFFDTILQFCWISGCGIRVGSYIKAKLWALHKKYFDTVFIWKERTL